MNRVLPALLILLAAGACGSKDLGPPTVTAKLTVEPSSASVGTSMTIALHITHTGNGETTFSVFEDGHSFNPSVKDGAGATVWSANDGRQVNPARRDVVLEHGQEYVTTVVWTLTSSGGSALPPGTYSITSALDATGLAAGFSEITAPVTIKPSE